LANHLKFQTAMLVLVGLQQHYPRRLLLLHIKSQLKEALGGLISMGWLQVGKGGMFKTHLGCQKDLAVL
jgi:hypothetical protein